MISLLLSISTVLFFRHALGTPFWHEMNGNLVRTGDNLEPCRMIDGPATCVVEKLRKEGNTEWCSHRLCAPSYVAAEACPADQGLQATAKCSVKEVTMDKYKCDGVSFKSEMSPSKCKIGTAGCKEISACSCTKFEGQTSRIWTREAPYKPECASGDQVNVDCAKCGQVLECYVNSGSSAVDQAVCNTIEDQNQFCPNKKGKASTCNQQCRGAEGVRCFPGESWGTCPAVLGSKNGAAKCKGGANGGPAALSNFASYSISYGATKEVTCLNQKCDTGTTCPCAQL